MKKFAWIFPIILLVLSMLACASSSNTGTKVDATKPSDNPTTSAVTQGQSTDEPVEAQATDAPKNETFNVGDVVEVKGHRIALTGAAYANGILKANFLIDNTAGKEELAVSSMISFSAKSDDGTKLEQSIFDCGTALDGKVLAGDKLKGDVCYKLATPGPVKIYYESALFSSGAVIWKLDTASLPNKIVSAPASDSVEDTSTVKTYKVGEVVEVNNHKITLNSAAVANNILKANFTIENNGTEDMAVSSMLSFSAKSSDGTKLDQEIMSCSSAQVDGKVLPNDKVKGDICWKTGGATTGLKIYYTDTLFSNGAVVWSVK
jgi:hypothetical protein